VHDAQWDAVFVVQLVRIAKATAGFHRDQDRGAEAYALTPLTEAIDDLLEVRAVDEFHHQEIGVLALTNIEYGDDIGVIEAGA